ncbi:hypothetical protein BC827DRAFT_1265505 [Russula dissimulans]|nr:hypothetical protein BC827DRAFT_1265505 [Russula dissimulans]
MSVSLPSPISISPNVNVEEIAAPQVRPAICISSSDLHAFSALLILGGLGDWFLFGVLVVQILSGVFLLETLQTALDGADLYYWFASGFGNIDHLTSPYATPFDVPMTETLVSLTVQFFFMRRIMVLSQKRSWWLCVFILLCSIVGGIAAFSVGVCTHIRGKYATGRILKMLMPTWVTGNTISDLLITSALVFYAEDQGSLSGHAVVSIVRLLVETNIATSKRLRVPDILMYCARLTYVTVKPSYSNTLLVSLNNHIAIRERAMSCSCERIIQSPAGSFPHNTCSSGATTGISLTDMRKTPNTVKIIPLGGLDVDENHP